MDALVNLTLSNPLADLAARIVVEHEQATSAMQAGHAHALKAGELLLAAKKQVEHGQWEAWIGGQCGIHERTAQLYMKLAREIPKLDPEKAKRVSLLSFREAMRVMATPAPVISRTLHKIDAVEAAAAADPGRFGELLDDIDGGKVDRAFQVLRIARAREDYERRKEQGGAVDDLAALAASGFRASVIVADYASRFETFSENGRGRSAEQYYDTQLLSEVIAMADVMKTLASPDAKLFLWTTWPRLLLDPAGIFDAWGFRYSTDGFVWIKLNPSGEGLHMGMGYATRANSEPCLLGTRGSLTRLDRGVPELIFAPRGRHSEKPNEFYDRVERLYPGPYLELFARKPRPDWVTWGDEVPRMSAAEPMKLLRDR